MHISVALANTTSSDTSKQLAVAKDHDELANLVDGVGKERFILSRTDSEEAIRWALTLGVRRFQGFFIDTLVNRQIEKEGKLPGDHRQTEQVH